MWDDYGGRHRCKLYRVLGAICFLTEEVSTQIKVRLKFLTVNASGILSVIIVLFLDFES
jgi:hypothetical protein